MSMLPRLKPGCRGKVQRESDVIHLIVESVS
jgi:hypothetical protein